VKVLQQFVVGHGSAKALLCLITIAACGAAIAKAAHIPAAFLIAPLIVSAIFAVRGLSSIRLTKPSFFLVQGIIGVSLASSFTASSLAVLQAHWLPVLFVVLSMQVFTIINALFFVYFGKLSPATALLGTLPGGAGEMAAISETFGADARVVSVMQYTRLLVIVLMVSVGSSIIGVGGGSAGNVLLAPAVVSLGSNMLSLLVAIAGVFIGLKLRIPAGTMIVPLFLSLFISSLGFPLGFAQPVLWLVYAALGLQIGSQFDQSVVERMKHLAFSLIGASLFLMFGSMLIAVAFSKMINLSGVTAYLAATPGGLDSVAVIASEVRADPAIVLTVHFSRLVLVLTTGPLLVKLFSRIMTGHIRTNEIIDLEKLEKKEVSLESN
jgi:membrane AbrB-like protein